MDKLHFQSFASGSSGNCYFIGNAVSGILVDAGIGVRTIRKNLKAIGLDFSNIQALLITHDHADHIRAAGILGEKHHIPVYTTKLIHEGINRSYCVTEKLNASRRYVEKNETIEIGSFQVTAFPVSHDATDSVGYTLTYNDKRFTFATDLGYVCEDASRQLKMANYLVFEANYDEAMLSSGHYPPYLKQRIRSNTGHLSNLQTATFLAENKQPHWQWIFLCHLSKENNQPELAFTTVKNKLEHHAVKVGIDVQLKILERFKPTELFVLS